MAFQVLNHSVVLGTGGSRGIGAATAKYLASTNLSNYLVIYTG